MEITIFNQQSGEILRVVQCPEELAAVQCVDGQVWIEGSFPDSTHRFDVTQWPPVPIEKTLLTFAVSKSTIAADGVDSAVIAGVPVGCRVTLNGDVFQIDDGEVEITADVPGVQSLIFQHPLYLPTTMEITAE